MQKWQTHILSCVLAVLGSVLVLCGCDRDNIHSAAKRGDLPGVRSFHTAGSPLDEPDRRGMTVLTYATIGCHVDIIEYVIEKAPDSSREDPAGRTMLHIAAVKDCTEALAVLLPLFDSVDSRNDIDETPLHSAALRGRMDAMQWLIDHGADVNATGHDGQTPLHLASLSAPPSAVRLLLESGARTDPSTNLNGWTALHHAVKYDNSEVVRLLIDAGADWTAVDSQGKSVIERATQYRATKSLPILLDKQRERASGG